MLSLPTGDDPYTVAYVKDKLFWVLDENEDLESLHRSIDDVD